MKWFNEETVLQMLKNIEKKPIDLECVKEVNGRLVPCLRSGIQIIPPKIEDYPSIEIPDKHGRLGDLDLCLKTFKIYCQGCKKEIDCYSCWVSDTFDIVKRIPTVLEASE